MKTNLYYKCYFKNQRFFIITLDCTNKKINIFTIGEDNEPNLNICQKELNLNFKNLEIKILDLYKEENHNLLTNIFTTNDFNFISWNGKYLEDRLIFTIISYFKTTQKNISYSTLLNLHSKTQRKEQNLYTIDFLLKEVGFDKHIQKTTKKYYSSFLNNFVLNIKKQIFFNTNIEDDTSINLIQSILALPVIHVEPFSDKSTTLYLKKCIHELITIKEIYKQDYFLDKIKKKEKIIKDYNLDLNVAEPLSLISSHVLSVDPHLHFLDSDSMTLGYYINNDFYNSLEITKNLLPSTLYTLYKNYEGASIKSNKDLYRHNFLYGNLDDFTERISQEDKSSLLLSHSLKGLKGELYNEFDVNFCDVYDVIKIDLQWLKLKLCKTLNVFKNYKYNKFNDLITKDNITNIEKRLLVTALNNSNKLLPSSEFPLDNKMQSLILITNLITYDLINELHLNSGNIIALNENSLYVSNIGEESLIQVLKNFSNKYKFDLQFSELERVIVLENNLIEITKNKISKIQGDLSPEIDNQLINNLNMPIVVKKLILNYLIYQKNWISEPIDIKQIKNRAYSELKYFNMKDWFIILPSNKSYFIEDYKGKSSFNIELVSLNNVNRCVFSKDGKRIYQKKEDNLIQIPHLDSNLLTLLNTTAKVAQFSSNNANIDVESYISWAYQYLDSIQRKHLNN